MANSVEPDQTAPLDLHCLFRPVCLKSKDHYSNFSSKNFLKGNFSAKSPETSGSQVLTSVEG